MSRTIVLLGAGASADAGLPLTNQLARLLVEEANASRTLASPTVRALNFVYGEMVGHQADDGGNPLRAVNIEKLISAVRLLRSRSDHEVMPFVASWKPGALGFGSPNAPTRFGHALSSAIEREVERRGSASNDLVRAVSGIAVAAVKPESPTVFSGVEIYLLRGIKRVLRDLRSVDYLEPLSGLAKSQAGGLDIITLNYDLGVETMAKNTGVGLNTGIAQWAPGKPLSLSSKAGQINLYKLHGSIDWSLEEAGRRDAVTDAPVIRQGDANDDSIPWIVVGDREKLATDGPTLALLHAAQGALAKASHLVVVGYSFGDAHINAMIRDWMLGSSKRTFTVLDYGWPELNERDDPRLLFAARYGAEKDSSGEPTIPRMAAMRGRAKESLPGALDLQPGQRLDPYFSASATRRGEDVQLTLTLLGPTLANVVLWPDGEMSQESIFNSAEHRADFVARNMLRDRYGQAGSADTFTTGSSLTFYPLVDPGRNRVEAILSGEDLIGSVSLPISVPIKLSRPRNNKTKS